MTVNAAFQQESSSHPVSGGYAQPGPGITEAIVTPADVNGVSGFSAAGVSSVAVLTVQGTASGVAIPVSGTGLGGGVAQGSATAAQLGTLVQGATTTAAPTYVTATTNPLSLTTAGSLRTVDNATVAQGSTTAAQVGPLVQGAVTTAAPTYTTAQTSPVSLTTAGGVRIDGVWAQASTTAGQTGALVMGAVTTAAPTYVTGNSDPISLTTTGMVRTFDVLYRDTTVTAQAGGTSTGPAGGATIVTVTPGTAGIWEVTGGVSVTGTSVVGAESNNMGLYQTAASVLVPIPMPCTTAGSGMVQPFGPLLLNLSGADTVNVKAIGAATATAVYAASVVARRVS